jgi:thimet oligopeptidase
MNLTQLFDFQSFTPEFAEQICQQSIENSKQNLRKIYEISPQKRNFENTLRAYDAIIDELSSVASVCFLLFCTSPKEELRNACNENSQKVQQFMAELVLDAQLYQAIKEYASSEEVKVPNKLEAYQQKMLAESLRDFEQNGLGLPAEEQEILKDLQKQLIILSNEFQKNSSEITDFLIIEKNETRGLPEDYLAARKQEDGNYKIDLSYPSYLPFMKYAYSESNRKALYIKYLNRGADKNLDVLQQVLVLRKRIANMLGYASYAAQCHSNLMSKTPQAVWEFELDLVEKVRAKAEADYQELLAIREKNIKVHNQLMAPWDTAFWKETILSQNYKIDSEEVKQYFETDQVLEGIFTIASKLFGISFVEQHKNISTWHEEVRLIEVQEDGKLIGKIYLDLFPRANKYNHAACFPLVSGREIEINGQKSYQNPILALVCNFPAATTEKPSLLTHNDVETFFHEFGHALHVLLTTSPVSIYAGTNTKRDFVEVPSQWFEAWAWNYEALSLFAKHYQSGEILPKTLFDKMLAAKNLGSGLFAQAQLFYAIYDLTLHDTYNPEGEESTTDILEKLQNQYTQFKYIKNTHFQAAFGHLMGYAASYYGYMWAKVYAEDCISVFEKQGMFDAQIGKKFRNAVLANGGSKDEFLQIEDFLGRKPNSEAFLQSLAI